VMSNYSLAGFKVESIQITSSFWNLDADVQVNSDVNTIVSGEPINVGVNAVLSSSLDEIITRHWSQLTRCVYPGGVNSIKGQSQFTSFGTYVSMHPECSVVKEWGADPNIRLNRGNNSDTYQETQDTTANFALGDVICYVYSLNHFNTNNAIADPAHPGEFIYNQNWMHSAPTCVRVNQMAGLNIRGSDSWSGGTFASSSNLNSSSCAVSSDRAGGFTASRPFANMSAWSQYGLFSLGKIEDGFGSGGWTATLAGKGDTAKSIRLKFANSSEKGVFYGTNLRHCLTDLYGYYDRLDAGGGTTDITRYYTDHIINTGWTTVNSGRRVILVDGNLTINGNIVANRAGMLTSLADIPELLILVNGNISISGNVNRIDATLMARSSNGAGGIIDTCYQGDNALPLNAGFSNTGVCYNQLVVNGALVGDELKLKRTWGPTKMNEYSWGSSKTAEIINYSIAIPLTDFYYRINNGRGIHTVLYREVAPRI